MCTDVSVRILDSAVNRFVSPGDIRSILTSSAVSPIGRPRDEINLHDIENLLNSRSAISKSDASLAYRPAAEPSTSMTQDISSRGSAHSPHTCP